MQDLLDDNDNIRRVMNEMANTEEYLRREVAMYRKLISHHGNANLLNIISEVADNIGQLYVDDKAYYQFKGVLVADDDVYYVMKHISDIDTFKKDESKGSDLLLSCVGNLDTWGFKLYRS